MKELTEYKDKAEKYKSLLAKKDKLLEGAKSTLGKQQCEVQRLQRSENILLKEKRQLEAKWKDASSELKDLQQEIKDFHSGRDRALLKLKKQLTDDHTRAEKKWKNDLENGIRKAEEDVKDHYKKVITANDKQISDLQSRFNDLEKEYTIQSKDLEENTKQKHLVTTKLHDMEKKYTTDRITWKKQRQHLEDINTKKTSDAKIQQKSFADLMDVKLALDTGTILLDIQY